MSGLTLINGVRSLAPGSLRFAIHGELGNVLWKVSPVSELVEPQPRQLPRTCLGRLSSTPFRS